MKKHLITLIGTFLICVPVFAQQTGSISGKVTGPDGDALPGVTVEAKGDVLPRPRTAITSETGAYRFQLLPPGNYELSFRLDGLGPQSKELRVLLQQNSSVDVKMQLESISEEVSVVAEIPLIDVTSTEIKASIDSEVIEQLPVGQEYRDLVKLIPGVQYSEEETRGPSAGGSGQDNVYLFDGVNVGLPLFGTLSAEPSSHDIAQVSIIKGGAKAVDFNRSGGFTIDSVSRSGTDRYRGEVSYQIQTDGMTGNRDTESDAEFERDRDWSVVNFGGPLVSENLYFYASYYRPTTTRDNRSNLYGAVPDSESTRDEIFGKLTFTPSNSILINGSYRDSDTDESGNSVTAEDRNGTASVGDDATLKILTLDGSWVATENSYLSFKFTDFQNETSSQPDNLLNFPIRSDGTVQLDVNNLDRQGTFSVPQPIAGEDAFNAFIAPLIGRYGFIENGVATGGGVTGVGSTISLNDFNRESFQLAYDHQLGAHDLHFGYQNSSDEEDLARTSNGWGSITVLGGRSTVPDGTPIFYEARFEQQSLEDVAGTISPVINSELQSQSIEINDNIKLNNWTFNIGIVASNDELFGQGLRENSSNLSGFELAPGNTYKMYEVDFDEMIQPRLGATWSPNGVDSVFASVARYYPAASSLPRAASWARNLRRSIRGFFDAQGNLIGVDPVRSSSGKFFQEGLTPRSIDEYIIGYSKQVNSRWTLKTHARYRYGQNFWEDTNNNARSRFEAPAPISQADYIPNLSDFRDEIGGSSYVIAELDDAFTKYYEAGVEADWRGSNSYFKGSYVWSHYYGNFDQDNSTTSNDANVFIGSSFIADGAGRQLWNNRYGNLRGDRRHQLKLYGYYNFNWNGSAGAYAVYQSGQPWEAWDVEVYRRFTGSSSDTSRFAEPAGSRTTSDHYQIDLNYTHNFKIGGRYNIQVAADVFNALDRQTGYNIQNKVNSANFGSSRSFFDPRRFQLAVKFQF
ncbi:MAG: carboxypeptidase regulatory-like domain-containing protein [Deltaproteobacteria bacterium]|nr:carboxypeptidase regulatory-like domain-containing protein [Deltaproteobacteria bacterium]